jgi:exodeoxyribonuclease VII small subunit
LATFEESLKQLETIVAQLERGDLPLEDSIKMFEEGMRLSAQCKQELDSAESKVQILLKQRDGSIKPEPFPLKSVKRRRGISRRNCHSTIGAPYLAVFCEMWDTPLPTCRFSAITAGMGRLGVKARVSHISQKTARYGAPIVPWR